MIAQIKSNKVTNHLPRKSHEMWSYFHYINLHLPYSRVGPVHGVIDQLWT